MFVLSVQRSEEFKRYGTGGAEEKLEETGGLGFGDSEIQVLIVVVTIE